MPNIRISALPPAVLPLDDPNTLFEVTVLEAGEEVSRKITLEEIAGATGLDASFLTLSANAQLPNERVLTEGANITFVDTGPNGTLTISASSTTSFPILAPDGTVGAPSYSFASDPDSGMFLVGADILGLSAGGVQIAQAKEVVGANQFILTPGLADNNPAFPTLAFGDGDTGFFELGDDIMSLSLSGAEAWRWQSTRFGPTAFANGPSMQAENATATNPTLVPNVGDSNTGIGQNAVDQVSIIAGAVEIARATEAAGANQFAIAQSGASTVPELTSLADPDTGWRWTGANQLTAINGGSRSFHFTSGRFFSEFSEGPALLNTTAQLTVPTVLPDQADANTGLGSNGNDTMSLVAGGIAVAHVVETGAVGQFAVLAGVAATPGLTFIGDLDTGFFQTGGDRIQVSIGGVLTYRFDDEAFSVQTLTKGAFIQVEDEVTATIPGYAFRDDGNTGLGSAGNDIFTAIAGGIEALSLAEISSGILQTNQHDTSIVASTTQTQGQQPLVSSYNEVSSVVNPNDVVTAPSVGQGLRLIIINNGASVLQVFAASGDNIGGGVDGSITIQSGDIGIFMGRDSTDWDTLFNAPATPSGAVVPDPLLLSSGGAGVPTYSFAADTDTGVFNPALDILGLTAGGVLGLSVTEAAGAITVDVAGTLSVFEATLVDSIQFIPDLVSPSINFDGASFVDFTGPSSSLGYRFDQGARFGNTLRINNTIPTLLFEVSGSERAGLTALDTSLTLDVGAQTSGNLFQINDSLVTMWSIDATNGMRVFETGAEVDFFEIRHNGSDVLLTSAGAAKVRFSGVAGTDVTNEVGNFEARSGNALIAFDASNADFIRISQNGTDTLMANTGSASVLHTGVTIGYKYDNSIYITEQAAANADTAGEGQFWTRDDVPNIPMFTNDVGIDFKLGVANDAVQARRTTSFTITTAFTDVTLDTTDIETDGAIIEHSATTDRIEATVAGTYEFTYGADIDPSAAGNDNIRAFGRMRLNDAGVDLPGSLASTSAYNDASTIGNDVFTRLQCSFIVVLAAGDFVTLQLMKVETGGTGIFTAEEVTVTAKRLL